MKILVDVGHPAHIHPFKLTIWRLKDVGHEIKIVDRGILINLPKAYGIDHANTWNTRRT